MSVYNQVVDWISTSNYSNMELASLLELFNIINGFEVVILSVLRRNLLIESFIELLTFLSCRRVIPVSMRMNLQIETSWVFEESFDEKFVYLLGSHLLDCCNFLLNSVKIKFFPLDLLPIQHSLLSKALILLL